jgi:ribosomal protein S6
MEEKDKKEYELAVLVATEDDLAPVVALVKSHNGEMASEPRSKKIALAYEIKKHKEGIFAYCNFKASGEDVKNIERDLNRSAKVIRSLVVIALPPDTESRTSPDAMPGSASAMAGGVSRRPRTTRSSSSVSSTGSSLASAGESKPSSPSQPLSNEALEKKIAEVLGDSEKAG